MRKKLNKESNEMKTVKFIPLSQNIERAKQLLFRLFECYPYNSLHKRYDLNLNAYVNCYFKSKIWINLWKEMYKLGHINKNLVSQSDGNSIVNVIKRGGNFEQVSITPVKNIIDYILPKIPEGHTNHEYRETPPFSILKDFLLLIYSYLLPEGISWKDFLTNSSIGNEYDQYLFPLSFKSISKLWENKMIERSTLIRKEFLKSTFERGIMNDMIIKILTIPEIHESPSKDSLMKEILQDINNIEVKQSIPERHQSNMNQIILDIKVMTGEEKSQIISPRTSFPSGSSHRIEVKFGLEPHIYYDTTLKSHKENEVYEYELDSNVDLLLTPELFRKQINEILQLFYGHANLQIDADGILRYRQAKYEDHQVHLLVDVFASKNLSILVPQLDELILLEEQGNWKQIIRNCRRLIEDYIRSILRNKRIQCSTKITLKPIIKKMRDNKAKLFKFPKWVVDDPFVNFDNYLLGLKYLGDVLNPNIHTESISVSQKEAISIKNTVISILISLTGFLK